MYSHPRQITVHLNQNSNPKLTNETAQSELSFTEQPIYNSQIPQRSNKSANISLVAYPPARNYTSNTNSIHLSSERLIAYEPRSTTLKPSLWPYHLLWLFANLNKCEPLKYRIGNDFKSFHIDSPEPQHSLMIIDDGSSIISGE